MVKVIRIEFPKRGVFTKDRILKQEIDTRYARYHFSSVETEGRAKKRNRHFLLLRKTRRRRGRQLS